MLKIAICDDDEVLCHTLEKTIIEADFIHGGEVMVEVFFSGEGLCKYMKQGNLFDIIFLDIELGKLDGISVGHEIRDTIEDEMVQIVYISSKDSYAMSLFAVRPMNFLIKPILEDDIYAVLKQIYHLKEKKNVLYEYRMNRQSNYIAVGKIQYIEVNNRQITIHTQKEIITYYGKMSEVEEKLKRECFLRISRSELVNYDAIEAYQLDKVRLYGGLELSIANSRQKKVQEQMLCYVRERM